MDTSVTQAINKTFLFFYHLIKVAHWDFLITLLT